MLKSNPILLLAAVLLIVSLACVLPSTVTPDPNFINTAIAQTIAAGVTQAALSDVPIILESPTVVQTFTPELPTAAQTPTETLTPTPVFTFTPLVPFISVAVATNCRVGPGRQYDRVGALLVGELAEVYGRDPTGAYWYIRNPDSSPEFCWLWGEYATLVGNIAILPVYTPPPTPTPAPDFKAIYVGKDTCTGWWVEFELENTGGISFKSISLTVRDTATNTILSMYADGFTDRDGCPDSVTRDNLNPGAVRTVSSPAFAYDPAGHSIRATITLCSNTGQTGICVSKVINFTA
ncbi:MAG: SH3 domain-containing protein [Anaerolineae bacterium]|nr:SH3 domain-containing protein [Anaerolineae bacterium]MCI0609199.1 SH3 domain-containing protein [Anaerolineae bacterium]